MACFTNSPLFFPSPTLKVSWGSCQKLVTFEAVTSYIKICRKKNMVGHVGCRNLVYHGILPPPVVDRPLNSGSRFSLRDTMPRGLKLRYPRRWASALKSNRSSSCYPCVSDMSAIFSHNHNFPCMLPFKFPLTIEQIHRHPYISYQTGYHIVFPLFTPVSKWNP